MKIINFGSINIDHVYGVEHFVRPGETLNSGSYAIFSGGKGANQSIALALAGAKVMHAGKLGVDGLWLRDKLQGYGVDTGLIEQVGLPTGHAVIQVNAEGENAIIIHGGANKSILDEDIEKVFTHFERGDYLLLQNEINAVDKILQSSKARGINVVFNPAPMGNEVKDYPLECVDIFIINETEGKALTAEDDPQKIVSKMQSLYPKSKTILTLGSRGVIYKESNKNVQIEAIKVEAVDTTGAGDTFIGYFLAELMQGKEIEMCLHSAVKASAISVTRRGAADSIPMREEVESLTL